MNLPRKILLLAGAAFIGLLISYFATDYVRRNTKSSDGLQLYKSYLEDPIPSDATDIHGYYRRSIQDFTVLIRFHCTRAYFDRLVNSNVLKYGAGQFKAIDYSEDLYAQYGINSWLALEQDWWLIEGVKSPVIYHAKLTTESYIFLIYDPDKSDVYYYFESM